VKCHRKLHTDITLHYITSSGESIDEVSSDETQRPQPCKGAITAVIQALLSAGARKHSCRSIISSHHLGRPQPSPSTDPPIASIFHTRPQLLGALKSSIILQGVQEGSLTINTPADEPLTTIKGNDLAEVSKQALWSAGAGKQCCRAGLLKNF